MKSFLEALASWKDRRQAGLKLLEGMLANFFSDIWPTVAWWFAAPGQKLGRLKGRPQSQL
jgi:hypothetical protein